MAEGIRKRHSKDCPAKGGGRCRCGGRYEASVYSARDDRRIYKAFARESEAKSWRAEAKRALDRGSMRAPSARTLREVAVAWLEGVERGEIRNRSGHPFKPSTIRGYRTSLNERILPLIGGRKVNAITTADLQEIVDGWQVEGQAPSTIRNSLKPLQAVYRRARTREGLAMNPTHDLELPSPNPAEVRIVAPETAAMMLSVLPIEDRGDLGDRDLCGPALRRVARTALGGDRLRLEDDQGPRVMGPEGGIDRTEDPHLGEDYADARGGAGGPC